jgi:hypothetical protein
MDRKKGLFVHSVHKVHAVDYVHSYILSPFFEEKGEKARNDLEVKG